MEVKILGCSGGKTPKNRLTSFLVDGVLAVDSGSLTQTLTVEQQMNLKGILFTHSHLDHIYGLAFLYKNIIERRSEPLQVYSTKQVINCIRNHLFSSSVMPGYAEELKDLPGLSLNIITPGEKFTAGSYEVESVRVNHPGESVGFFISDGSSVFANTGDTGPTWHFWNKYKERGDVDILITETSFPNSLQVVADLSQHLSPRTLAIELAKGGLANQPVHISHLKPAYIDQLRKEINEIDEYNIIILQDGDLIKKKE